MPSKKQYDLVLDDGPDSKIPLHNEDAFQHGIHFNAKYIGTLDVPRPTSRVEIVSAMRRIRYEFKAKAVKKKRVSVTVSVDGVKVVQQKKVRRKQQQWPSEDSRFTLLQHPIYRIFYVSHDSQDLKIFSYIARDSTTNVFRCNVFKSYKKSQAMNIVRTIGQAFEVCHRISLQAAAQNEEGNDAGSEKSSEDGNSPAALQSTSTLEKPPMASSSSDNGTSTSTQSPEDAVKQTQQLLETLCINPFQPSETLLSPVIPVTDPLKTDHSVGTFHRVQLLHQQLELQMQQTQFLVAQVQLLKDQLAAETAARIEAQTRTNQLLLQNRELLSHISALVNRLVQLETSANDTLSSDLPHSPSEMLTAYDSSAFDASSLFVSASSGLSRLNESNLFPDMHGKLEHRESGDGKDRKDISSGGVQRIDEDSSDARPSVAPLSKTCDNLDLKCYDIFNSLNNTNGETILNALTKNNLKNNQAKNEEEIIKIVTPIPPQDASGNRLELNIAPKLDPPPRVSRNSSRLCGSKTTSFSHRPVPPGPPSTLAVTADNVCRPNNVADKRFIWQSDETLEKSNGLCGKNLNAFPSNDQDNSKEKSLLPTTNGNEKGQNSVDGDSVRGRTLAIQGFKGIKNRFAIQHQDSIDSTAKLKLSFSDNE